jgi:hypothetical protein
MEISFINRSSMSEPDFAYAIRACHDQMVDDFMPAWRGRLDGPDQQIWPCVGYLSVDGLRPGSYCPIGVLDEIGKDGSLGYHDYILGAYGRSLPLVETFSHEALELRADPFVNLWVPMPNSNGRQVALEVGDPVQNDSYTKKITIAGLSRDVPVSNFVYPSWFDPNGKPPFDHMRLCTRPFENRGYLIVKEPDEGVSFVFAKTVERAGRARYAAKADQPWTRTFRRLERRD